MNYKKGQKAVMMFHCAGCTSEEEFEILKAHRDGTITLKTDNDDRRCFRFDTKTGRCLNDNTAFGASRELKIEGITVNRVYKDEYREPSEDDYPA